MILLRYVGFDNEKTVVKWIYIRLFNSFIVADRNMTKDRLHPLFISYLLVKIGGNRLQIFAYGNMLRTHRLAFSAFFALACHRIF